MIIEKGRDVERLMKEIDEVRKASAVEPKYGGAKICLVLELLFTCLAIPGDCRSAAWDNHTQYLAVKLCANMTEVGVIPK